MCVGDIGHGYVCRGYAQAMAMCVGDMHRPWLCVTV